MFSHLFKLIWNKKKQNILMMAEMLISFLVIFALSTLIVFFFKNYRKPLGFDYENVWVVSFSNPLKTSNMDSLATFYKGLRETVRSLPKVKEAGFSSDNIPFYQNTWSGSINYEKKEVSNVDNYWVDENYKDVLNVKLLEGRWFSTEDKIAKEKPVIINTSLKKELFGQVPALGKFLGDNNNKRKVVGIIEDV